jgi:hypothetical protein
VPSATQWAPREDLGVAAVDGRTGEILWEAWNPVDLPADVPDSVKDAAKRLLDARQWWRDPDGGYTGFPYRLGENRVVQYSYDTFAKQNQLKLVQSTDGRPGRIVAQVVGRFW